jgi:SAM-dependent methyltransferase
MEILMSENDDEYHNLVARSWDIVRGDTSGYPDRQYFRKIVANDAEPVLIVGCGTGRLLLEYAADGLDVDGLDVSPEMLAICQEKAAQQGLGVTLYAQSMAAMDLPRRYKTIIVPESAFQLMPDLADAGGALQGFYDYLLPGGLLVMTIWHINSDREAGWSDWWLVLDADGYKDGQRIKQWERSMYDSAAQLRHSENRYEIWENGRIVYEEKHRRSPELRNYSLGVLTTMVEKAGFTKVHAVSEFSHKPADEDDAMFCILGMKA